MYSVGLRTGSCKANTRAERQAVIQTPETGVRYLTYPLANRVGTKKKKKRAQPVCRRWNPLVFISGLLRIFMAYVCGKKPG